MYFGWTLFVVPEMSDIRFRLKMSIVKMCMDQIFANINEVLASDGELLASDGELLTSDGELLTSDGELLTNLLGILALSLEVLYPPYSGTSSAFRGICTGRYFPSRSTLFAWL